MNGRCSNTPDQAQSAHIAVTEPRSPLVLDGSGHLVLESAEVEVQNRLLVAVGGRVADDRFELLHFAIEMEAVKHLHVAEVCRHDPPEGSAQVRSGVVVEAMVAVHEADALSIAEDRDAKSKLVATALLDGRPDLAAHLREMHRADLNVDLLVVARDADGTSDDDVFEAELVEVRPQGRVELRRFAAPGGFLDDEFLAFESPLGGFWPPHTPLGVEHQTVTLLRHPSIALGAVVEVEEDIRPAFIGRDEAEQLVGCIVEELHSTRFHIAHSLIQPSGFPFELRGCEALMAHGVVPLFQLP